MAMLAALPAPAQVWTAGAGDNAWSTGGNWSGGVAPASAATTTVLFDATGATFAPFADLPWTINRLLLTGGTPYLLSGGPLTFAGPGSQITATGAAHTLAAGLALATPVALSNTGDLTITGTLAGTDVLTKTGTGRLTLLGPVPLSGTIAVSGGVLGIGDGTIGPPAVSANIVTNTVLEFAVPGGTSVNGIFGVGSLVVGGGGLISAGPDFTHGGPTTVNSGTLSARIVNNARLTIAAGAVVNMGGGTVGSVDGAGQFNSNTPGLANTVGGDGTDTTLSGIIAGPGGLTKAGAGRFTITGPYPLSGITTVNGGTLRFGDGVSGPVAPFAPMVSNAVLEFAIPAGAAVNGIGGTGSLVVGGGGLISTGPDFTHTGPTTVNSGTLSARIVNNARLTIAAGAVVNMGAGTVGSVDGAGQFNSNTPGLANTVGGDGTDTALSGIIAGPGDLMKVGAGRFTITGPYPLSGVTTVNGGTLRFGDGVSGPAGMIGPMVTNALLEFAVPGGTSVNGIGGTGSLVVGGGGLISTGTDFTHAGPTTVNSGTLSARIVNNARLTIAAGAVVNMGAGTVGSVDGAGQFNSNTPGLANTVGGDNTSTTFSGDLGGVGDFLKTGAGTLTLSGTSVSTGVKTVNGGRLLVNGTLPGPVVVSAGGTLGGTGTVSGPVLVNAGGVLAPGLSPGITNTGDLGLAGVLLVEIEGTAPGTQYDITNVTGTVTIAGGSLTLAGAYVPVPGDVFAIVVNDGADAVTGTFAGLPEGATVLFNGATLRVSYVGGTGNDITLTAVSTTTLTWNGAGANDNWSTGADWVAGVAPASGATTFVTFPVASARFAPVVDAPWTINRMDVASATSYAMSGQAITFAGAAPQLNASGGSHSLANPLALAAALTVNNAGALALSGPIGGASGLVKAGAGTLTLSGASAYAGGTTVTAGRLFVNGTIPGPVVVGAGATLGGTGTVSGPVTVNAGGSLAPGLSPGITNTGNLAIAGTLVVEIEGTTIGTQYDNTNVTGTVQIAGGALLATGAYVPVSGDVFTIVTNDGADPVTGTFLGLAEGATVTLNGVSLRISYVGGTGNDITLTAAAALPGSVTGVPTLSEWGLILLATIMAGMGMLARRRRAGSQRAARV